MIFGSYIYDVPDLCYVLDKLGIAYEVHDDNLRYLARPNPVVSLASSLKLIHRCKCPVVFVVDAKAALNKTNVDQTLCRVYTKHQLFQAVKNCVKNKQPLDLHIKEVSLAEIVDKITTKSVLTDVQTLVNKIQPYDLRKEIHRMIINYLHGSSSLNPLRAKLVGIPKFDALWRVVSSDKCKTIRQAVVEYLKVRDEEKVAKQYGVHTFEILYVFNSYSKL